MMIKPILFNTEMVRAILDGRKSCTRRLVKGFVPDDAIWGYTAFTPKGYISCRGTFADGYGEKFFKLPYQTGDILYVRETWTEECGKYYYRANYNSDYLDACETLSGGYPASCRNYAGCQGCTATSTRIYWHPSIHMPKEAARIWLKVTDVRVERLQEITEGETFEEGLDFTPPCLHLTGENYCDIDGPCTSKVKYCDMSYGELFGEVLWNNTIKKSDLDRYGWDANPWVWLIEFERCEKPEGEN